MENGIHLPSEDRKVQMMWNDEVKYSPRLVCQEKGQTGPPRDSSRDAPIRPALSVISEPCPASTTNEIPCYMASDPSSGPAKPGEHAQKNRRGA